jgi:hypothetical protein
MVEERVEPAERREVPEDEPSKEKDLRVVSAVSRCPFCHVPVDLATQEWVACGGCLARHHASCWRDHGSCSSCGGTKALAQTAARTGASWNARVALGLAVAALGLAIASTVTGWFLARRASDGIEFNMERQVELEKKVAELEVLLRARALPPEVSDTDLAKAKLAEQETVELVLAAQHHMATLNHQVSAGLARPSDQEAAEKEFRTRVFEGAARLLDAAAVYERAGRDVDTQRAKDMAKAITEYRITDAEALLKETR